MEFIELKKTIIKYVGEDAWQEICYFSTPDDVRPRLSPDRLDLDSVKQRLVKKMEKFEVCSEYAERIKKGQHSKVEVLDLIDEATSNLSLNDVCELYGCFDRSEGVEIYDSILSCECIIYTINRLIKEKHEEIERITEYCFICEGSGFLDEFRNYYGGVCFRCLGVGSLWENGKTIIPHCCRQLMLRDARSGNIGMFCISVGGEWGFTVAPSSGKKRMAGLSAFLRSTGYKLSSWYDEIIWEKIKDSKLEDCSSGARGVLKTEYMNIEHYYDGRFRKLPWVGPWRLENLGPSIVHRARDVNPVDVSNEDFFDSDWEPPF